MRAATVTTVLDAPQEEVFSYLAEIENLPLWATGVRPRASPRRR
jgi:uncharacterized protein YndB with AHSA1/START domain